MELGERHALAGGQSRGQLGADLLLQAVHLHLQALDIQAHAGEGLRERLRALPALLERGLLGHLLLGRLLEDVAQVGRLSLEFLDLAHEVRDRLVDGGGLLGQVALLLLELLHVPLRERKGVSIDS